MEVTKRVAAKSKRLKLSRRENEETSSLVDGILKATRKPGIHRDVVFRAPSGKRVYAYSVYPPDTSKIVREDANGRKTLGRLVQGKFKTLRSKTA